MASANIGMCELAYAEMPLQSDGSNLLWKEIFLAPKQQLLLISGAKGKNGMMRGEEIQAIGLADQLENSGGGILILPGTHSKHLRYENKAFTDLKTFMTGELFAVLCKHSILENNVKDLTKKYKDVDNLPIPSHWGGYIIEPTLIEFWQGRSSRLHDRICYRLEKQQWKIDRLAP